MNLKKNLESYLRVNLLGPGPRLIKKEFTGPRLRNTALTHHKHITHHNTRLVYIIVSNLTYEQKKKYSAKIKVFIYMMAHKRRILKQTQ